MKTTKKYFILMLAAVLAVVSLIPSTFSWYTHTSDPEEGNRIHIQEPSLPVSMKTASDSVSMQTFLTDKDGNRMSSNAVNTFSVDPYSVQHYSTVFTNTGNDDVMIDFNGKTLGNNADYYVGTESPTLNEKCYASRAARKKITGDSFRVYFKSSKSFYPYWTAYYAPTPGSEVLSSLSGLTNDMNVAYKLTTDENVTYKRLTLCEGFSTFKHNNVTYNYSDALTTNYDKDIQQAAIESAVFYVDIPTNVEYFFFFNHYYDPNSENKNWNSTLNISDFSQGKMYVMTGEEDGNKYKMYEAQPTDTDLVALNQYCSEVTMSLGKSITADIGLRKTGDEENFVPDYYGQSITYAVETQQGDAAGLVTVNRDGLIIPGNSNGTSHIKTTITGKYGDSKKFYTKVSIPSDIDQIPIMKNLLVGKQGSTTPEGKAGDVVVVDWYLRNNSSSAMTLDSVFFTV